MTNQIMSESTRANQNESCCEPTAESQETIENMLHAAPMEMCPMAGFCKGMMETEGRGSGLLLIPGAVLIATGVLIILAPTILAWLVAALLILLGIIALAAAVGVRRFLAKS